SVLQLLFLCAPSVSAVLFRAKRKNASALYVVPANQANLGALVKQRCKKRACSGRITKTMCGQTRARTDVQCHGIGRQCGKEFFVRAVVAKCRDEHRRWL